MSPLAVGINAQIVTRAATYRQAGVSRFTEQLLRALQARDATGRYSVYVNDTARGGFTDSSNMRFRYTGLPAQRPVVRIMWEQLVLPLLVRRDQIDVLHCPVNVLPLGVSCPTALTIHDLTFLRFPERFKRERRGYLAALTRYSARKANRIMTDSANTMRDVAELLGVPQTKIEVVYPGVDPELARPPDGEIAAFKSARGLPDEFLLFLGTLEPRKNLDTLIAAYALLKKRRAQACPLVIAGAKGWMFDHIFATVEREGLAGSVSFPGYVEPRDQPYWYAAATAFVYPSLYEGFGLPPLEAMACGTPVVVSNVSSLPEVVGDAGAQFDPNNADELAEVLGEVLGSTGKREHMAAAGLAQAASFTWERAALQAAQVYRTVTR